MLVVKTLQELIELSQKKLLKPDIYRYLKNHLTEIRKCLEPYIDKTEPFSLEESGPFYILQSGDDLHSLESAGLNSCDDGMFGAIPEEIRKLRLDSATWYEIAITYNNDYLAYFYLNPENFKPDSQSLNQFIIKYQ